MESINVYSFIISLFQDVAKNFVSGMVGSLVSVLKVNMLMTAIGMVVIIVFAIKKCKRMISSPLKQPST